MKNEKKPSERIMDIYVKAVNDEGPDKMASLGQGLPAFMQKIYCDSIVQYLDEVAHEKEA